MAVLSRAWSNTVCTPYGVFTYHDCCGHFLSRGHAEDITVSGSE